MLEDRSTSASPPDSVTAALQALLGEMRAKISTLEGAVEPFDSFDVISWIALRNLLLDPDNYREASHTGRAINVEYIALLCASAPYHPGRDALPSPNRLAEIDELVRDVTNAPFVRALASAIETRGDALAGHAYRQFLHESFVRIPAYPHHQQRILHALFDRFSSGLRGQQGFDVAAALRLSTAVHQGVNREISRRFSMSADVAARLRRQVRASRRPTKSAEEIAIPEEWLRYLLQLPERERRRACEGVADALVLQGLGRALGFTANDLASASGVVRQEVDAYLAAFSIPFGTVDPRFREPLPSHPLKQRPLLRHDNRYLAPLPDLLLWAIQPMFEGTLKRSVALWARYEGHRHGMLVQEAVTCLTKILEGSRFETELFYDVKDGGVEKRVEIDAVGMYDTAVFLVEAKGAALRRVAKAGVPEPLRDQVNDILTRAHEQALRAARYVRGGGDVIFCDRSGQARLTIPSMDAQSARLYLLSVTLEPLGHLTVKVGPDSPFVSDPSQPTWVVSLPDLYVITDCLLGYAPWLPHYIDRRLRVFRQNWLTAPEELDLFVYFLQHGLYFEVPSDVAGKDGEKEPDSVMLGGQTDPLDAYYYREAGLRQKPAPRPGPRVTAELASLIQRIMMSGLPGRLDYALAVIDMDTESRRGFLRAIKQTRKRATHDRMPHDFSVGGGSIGVDRWGITYVSAYDDEERSGSLRSYCDRKLAEERADRWFLLSETPEKHPKAWLVVSRRKKVAS
jgi:hypothetical protein